MAIQIHLTSVDNEPAQFLREVAGEDVVCLDLDETIDQYISQRPGEGNNFRIGTYNEYSSGWPGEVSRPDYEWPPDQGPVRLVVIWLDNAFRYGEEQNQSFIMPCMAVLATPSRVKLQEAEEIAQAGAVLWPKPRDYNEQKTIGDKIRILQSEQNATAGIELFARPRGDRSVHREPQADLEGFEPRSPNPPADFQPDEEQPDTNPRQFYEHPLFGYSFSDPEDLQRLLKDAEMLDRD